MATEKTEHTNTVTEVDSEHEAPEVDPVSKWLPGYAKRFPFVGALSLLCIVALACIALGVLIGSNGTSTSKWPQKIGPNVVLAMINALSSLALAVAVGEGVAIAWWRHAMKGSTVSELHHQWELSTGVFKLLWKPRSVMTSNIALAVLATQITLLNSIFYQRATSTYSGPDPPRQLSAIGIGAEEFPATGYVVSNTSFGAQTSCACFMIGDSFTPVVNTWETSNGFFQGYNELFRYTEHELLHRSDSFEYCRGVCYSSFEAIGFEIDCQDQTNHTDIAIPAINAYESKGDPSAWTNLPIFNSSFALEYASDSTNYSQIVLNLQYFQSDDPYNPKSTSCPGTVYQKQCSLRPAMISYPVKVTNFTNEHVINGVSLAVQMTDHDDPIMNMNMAPPMYDPALKQAEGYKVIKYLYPQDSHAIRSLTALGGIANAFSQFLSSTAAITYTGDNEWSLDQKGTLAQTMMYGPPNMGSCDCSFRNEALDTIIQSINQLTFLTATGMIDPTPFKGLPRKKTGFPSTMPSAQITAVDSNTTTTFRATSGTATQETDVVHYRTHYVYAGLAFGITILCIILVIPSFWHYGELGRRVTLGPVEIASAFGAPVLIDDSHVDEGTTAPRKENIDTLLKHIGDRKIVYGFVDIHKQDNAQQMHLASSPTSPRPDEGTTQSPGIQSPMMSPALSQGESGGVSKMQKRRSVRLAMGAPENVRPTSQVVPMHSPRL